MSALAAWRANSPVEWLINECKSVKGGVRRIKGLLHRNASHVTRYGWLFDVRML